MKCLAEGCLSVGMKPRLQFVLEVEGHVQVNERAMLPFVEFINFLFTFARQSLLGFRSMKISYIGFVPYILDFTLINIR